MPVWLKIQCMFFLASELWHDLEMPQLAHQSLGLPFTVVESCREYSDSFRISWILKLFYTLFVVLKYNTPKINVT